MANDDIQGTITDADGNVVQGATVSLFKHTGEVVEHTTTDASGNYIFESHPDGDGTSTDWHVVARYDDGNGNYNAFSKPYVDASLGPAIPDSVVLLDDWADGNLSSNRDDFETTPFNGSGSTLVNDGGEGTLQRPAWTEFEGTPSVANGELELRDGDMVYHDIAFSSLDNYIWEFKFGNVAEAAYINISANSTTRRGANGQYNFQDGYFIFLDETQVSLVLDDGGSATNLISGSANSHPDVVRIERDGSGNWELFVDETSQGTAADSTFTTSDRVAAATNANQSGSSVDLHWWAVDA